MGADPRLLDALASLNQIGAAINRIGPRERAGPVPAQRPGHALRADASSAAEGVKETLQLIVDSVIKVVPGATAAIYTYDRARRAFDPASRVSAGERTPPVPGSEPRPEGMGMRALGQRRPILSYQEQDLGIHPIQVEAGARAVACFPLVVADQDVGALYVYLHQARRFSQLELLMLQNLVNQAAMAIYQARWLADVQRDLARTEDELSRLRRAGLLISSRLGLEETLQAILQMALEVTNAHYGIFRLVDKGGQNLITRAIAGDHLDRPLVEALPIDAHSVMGWVAGHRQPVCIHDLRAEPWSGIYYPLDADLEMRSELAVPLIGASGRLEGVLNLESPVVGAFGDQDRHLLQALATQAVIAIQEVRLLDALQKVAQLLLTRPCQQVLSHLVDLACDLLNAAASAIWTLEGDQLILQVASAGHRHGECLPLHGSLTGQAILSGGPVVADDVRIDPRFHRPDLARAQNWAQALVVPLLASGEREPIGAFSVYGVGSDAGHLAGSEWDEKVLTCLAHYAVLAVLSAAHQEALRAAQEQRAVAETFAAVGDIAANLLHQLNNKVGTIPVRVQGIQDKCRPALLADLYLAANLAEIERSACEAMDTVRENLSHLHPIRLAPVNVAACVAAAVQATDLAGIQVQVGDLAGLPTVVAGRQSLTLVFANLLENAADAMQGEGVVTIRGAARDGWVEVAVGDSGPGIVPELHARIFEFNASGRATPRAGKLGFGLWWVKTLMVRLGGSVAVESDGCHGTTFRLRLPRAEEGPGGQARRPAPTGAKLPRAEEGPGGQARRPAPTGAKLPRAEERPGGQARRPAGQARRPAPTGAGIPHAEERQ
jgi:signal transduction histidine kinase/putative methionine-R-sulfoxide reductase with GAF domain